ncbi:hypothetical protein GCM10027415_04710 [Humibacter ginsengisoli]
MQQSPKPTYSYFFCRGVQDHTCDAPYSNIDKVEEAIEDHYKTITFSTEFIQAIRAQMQAAIEDQVGAQKLLREQLEGNLKRLAAKEDNLLDLAADGDLDTSRARVRLRDIARQRKETQAQLKAVEDDIAPGMAYIEAHIALLEDPYELYRHASDQTRRLLNQAIFKHIYVVNEEVVGDEINTPLRELLAAQRGWSVYEEVSDLALAQEAALTEALQHAPLPKEKQAAETDDLLDEFMALLLPDPMEKGGNCSKPSMVPLEGLEPPTVSLGRNCSSIELQRLAR